MSNIWFTSDTHFGHKNIVRACSNWSDPNKCRDFNSIEEHDDYIIEQINKFVKPQDILYHLGDFGLGFAWKNRLPEVRKKIKCERIKLIFGNHDHIIEHAFSKYKETREYNDITRCFESADYLKFGKIGGISRVLCHYAMKIWPWSHHGSQHLYAHSHGNLPDDPNSLSIDVGVDTCLFGHEKYTPYSSEEVDHIMKTQKGPIKFLDHHTSSTN